MGDQLCDFQKFVGTREHLGDASMAVGTGQEPQVELDARSKLSLETRSGNVEMRNRAGGPVDDGHAHKASSFSARLPFQRSRRLTRGCQHRSRHSPTKRKQFELRYRGAEVGISLRNPI